MAEMIAGARRLSLEGKVFAATDCAVTAAPSAFRMSLRAPSASVSVLSKALGVDLPKKPKTSAASGTRTAFWLGPDEWFVFDTKANPASDLSKVKALHSAVDISHRNTAIIVKGAAAAVAINGGCPQDLSDEAFPVGTCTRTVLGKIEVLLYRSAKTEWRVECWRSFSAYAFEFLVTSAGDAAA